MDSLLIQQNANSLFPVENEFGFYGVKSGWALQRDARFPGIGCRRKGSTCFQNVGRFRRFALDQRVHKNTPKVLQFAPEIKLAISKMHESWH